MPSTASVVEVSPAAGPDDHAGGAGAHQVGGRLVVGDPADDHRHVEVGDERLQVQRFPAPLDVFGRDDGPLDDQQLDAGRDHRAGQRGGVLRGEPYGDGPAAGFQRADRLGQQIRRDRGGVGVLEQSGDLVGVGIVVGGLNDAVDDGLRVGVAGPQSFGVQHSEPAEPADLDGDRRRHHRVGGIT